jgi:MFS transporter, DHA1 family, multidrug resistance protein
MVNGQQREWSRLAARRIITVLLLVSPLEQIALDVYTPALPKMAIDFAASNALVQTTVTAYVLGMAIVVLPAGLITDAIGRKRVLLGALGLVVLTSIGCALADNLTVMLGCRFAQGIGAGTCFVVSAAIAADCFRGAQLVSVLGLMGAAWGAAPVLAPAIGGFVVQSGSWRLVFAVLGLVAAALAILVARVLPETLAVERRSPVDLRAAAGVLRKALRHRVFVGFVAMFGVIGAAQVVFGVVSPFLYQTKLGFSPAAYGLIALVLGAANLAGALTCGRLAHRTTTRRLALVACRVFVLGGVILVVSAEGIGVNAWVITVGAALALFGIGVLDPLSKGLAMGVFARNIGLIAGLVSTCCYLSITIAMALTAYLPEQSQAPLGWFYIGAGALFAAIMLATLSRPARTVTDIDRRASAVMYPIGATA